MKIFIFRYDEYPYSCGDIQYDIIFANDLLEAYKIRKDTICENYCPTDKCTVTETELKPGIFSVIVSNKYNNERFAIPQIL